MSEPIIKLKSVSLSYKQRRPLVKTKVHPVLKNINLDVYPGETLGIIGRNGAGKSTLLKLFAGVLAPDSGIADLGTQRVVLLSFSLGFNPQLTGRENAIYSALLQGVSREEIDARMPAVIAFAGLEEVIDDKLDTYSSGMRARLGFSVAIQSDADVILVDEALGVGDHAFRAKSMAFMRRWIRSNKTVVYVSHEESSVKGLCDRVAWLEGGRVVMLGAAEEVLERYHEYDDIVERFAAQFKISPAEIRAQEVNRDPLEVIERVRKMVQTVWNKEDQLSRGQSKVVKYFRPKPGMLLSQFVSEECGSAAWVENTQMMCRGEQARVSSLYEDFIRMSSNTAEALSLKEFEYRKSKIYQDQLLLLRRIGKIE